MFIFLIISLSSIQSLSSVQLFATPWTTTHQASLSITNSWSPPKSMSIESVMPSNHLILCRPLLLMPSIFPSIGVFSNESALCIRWPKYWSFSFNTSPSNEHPGLISFRMDWLDLLAVQGTQTLANDVLQIFVCSFVYILQQLSLIILAPGISFMEDNFSMDRGGGNGLGMIQAHYIYYATTDMTGGQAQVVRRWG